MSSPNGFARFIIVLTTVSAAIMELVDTSIVNVGLSEMAGSLGATIEDIAWVITSYAIANVIIIPMTGFLADYFGRKNYYVFSMILFTIASYLCAESGTLQEIIIWRFIQGIGGGALLSTSQAILFDAFKPEDRPIAAGLFGMGIVLGPTLGPTIGGYLVEHFSWHWMFLVNIPIGIIATMLSITFVEKKPGEGTNRKNITIDYWGILLLMASIGCLQYVLERGEADDWFDSSTIRICAAVAFVGLIAFIIRELTIEQPVVNLQVMKNRTFAFTTIFTFVAGLGLFTSVFVYPVMTQRVMGYTPLETGLSLLTPTLAGVVMMPIMGRLMSKGVSPIPFTIIGFTLFSVYSFMSASVSPDISRWGFFLPLLVRAFGISMSQLPLINQAVAGLEPRQYASGIALNNMIRQIGGAFGIALANNYISIHYAQHRADMVSNLTPGSPALSERIASISNGIIARTGDAATALQKTYRLIELQVDRQAYFLAYQDTFRLVGIFFLLVLPLVFFLKVKKKPQAVDASAMKKAMEDAH